MGKYLTIFNLHWQSEFTYRFNFILWRVRNVLRLMMTYFLWRGIFLSSSSIFGYTQSRMFTYIFLVLIVAALVSSAPSADNVGSEISSGDLSNYLVKPVSYLKFWFTRDLSSKALNFVFSIFEVTILFLILKPALSLPVSFLNGLAFLVSITLAILLYFFLVMSVRFVAFWSPENTWPFAFLVFMIGDILGGTIFPLDILPRLASLIVQLTPFPYLFYFPIALFLGKITGFAIVKVLLQQGFWVLLMYALSQYLWKKGLKSYGSEGR